MSESSDNPYKSPDSQSLPVTDVGRPSTLALIFGFIVTLIASVLTFFFTCLGVGLVGEPLLGSGVLPLAIVCGFLAALGVAVKLLSARRAPSQSSIASSSTDENAPS